MKRLMSLDILRGITVCGMILVNNAGGKYSYAPLRHSVWNGLTLCDLVFPFFLFMVGISTYISLKRFDFRPDGDVIKKIFRRMFLIILIGILINWFASVCKGDFFPLDHLRITGVLQRIGLCYGIVSLIVVCVNHKYIPWIIVGLMIVYSVLLITYNGYSCDDTNFMVIADRAVFGEGHLYTKSPVDPEGLIGSISAVAHTLIGFMCGKLLLEKISINKKLLYMLSGAAVMLIIGYLLSGIMPINKRVWSTTYVLVTCGWASMLLAALIYIIDVRQLNNGWKFFLVFGMNPLFLYVFSEVLAIVLSQSGMKSVIYSYITALIPDEYLASLSYSIIYCLIMELIGFILWKKKIFIKI